jgi:ABC-type branched-subunit amino acid transport system substrate-binding protein
VYPIESGTIGSVLGVSDLIRRDSFKRPVLLRPDIAQAAVVPQLLNAGSVKLVADVTSPIGAADMTSYVTSALQHHPDALVVTLDDLQSAQVIQAVYQQSGGKVKVIIVADRFTSDQLKALGPAQGIVLGVLGMPPLTASQVPAVTQWLHDVDQFGRKDTQLTSPSENADIGIHMFAEVATGIVKAGASLTPASIVAALKAAPSINTFGATGRLNFHAPAKGLPFPLPNVYGVSVWYATASHDTWQLDGQRADLAGPA